jgi:hypothetical protein
MALYLTIGWTVSYILEIVGKMHSYSAAISLLLPLALVKNRIGAAIFFYQHREFILYFKLNIPLPVSIFIGNDECS